MGDSFGLVMPFVVCASQGGPYDDDSYVAGYEAGLLEARLAILAAAAVRIWESPMPFHGENTDQIDLIGMRYGYTVTFSDVGNGWMMATFRAEE